MRNFGSNSKAKAPHPMTTEGISEKAALGQLCILSGGHLQLREKRSTKVEVGLYTASFAGAWRGKAGLVKCPAPTAKRLLSRQCWALHLPRPGARALNPTQPNPPTDLKTKLPGLCSSGDSVCSRAPMLSSESPHQINNLGILESVISNLLVVDGRADCEALPRATAALTHAPFQLVRQHSVQVSTPP